MLATWDGEVAIWDFGSSCRMRAGMILVVSVLHLFMRCGAVERGMRKSRARGGVDGGVRKRAPLPSQSESLQQEQRAGRYRHAR